MLVRQFDTLDDSDKPWLPCPQDGYNNWWALPYAKPHFVPSRTLADPLLLRTQYLFLSHEATLCRAPYVLSAQVPSLRRPLGHLDHQSKRSGD